MEERTLVIENVDDLIDDAVKRFEEAGEKAREVAQGNQLEQARIAGEKRDKISLELGKFLIERGSRHRPTTSQ